MVSRRPTSQAQSCTRTTQVRGRGTSPLKVYAERMEDALNVIGRRDSPRKVANALSELCFMLDIVTSIYVTTNLEAERPVEDVPYDGPSETPCDSLRSVMASSQSIRIRPGVS